MIFKLTSAVVITFVTEDHPVKHLGGNLRVCGRQRPCRHPMASPTTALQIHRHQPWDVRWSHLRAMLRKGLRDVWGCSWGSRLQVIGRRRLQDDRRRGSWAATASPGCGSWVLGVCSGTGGSAPAIEMFLRPGPVSPAVLAQKPAGTRR